MTTTLFVSNETIQVVSGAAKGKKLIINSIITEPVKEGTIINGVITDASQLKNDIDQIFKNNKKLGKKINVIVDGSSINTKILEVPLLNEAKLMPFIETNYPEVENREKMLIDYMVLEGKTEAGGASVLSVLTEKDFVNEYSELITSLGIKIDTIDISLSSLIKLVKFGIKALGETFIVGVLDKNILALVLFVRGKFRFSRRIRIVSEIGSEEILPEMVKILSNMIQFNKSEKTNADITDIYIGGFLPADNEIYKQLTDSLDVNVVSFPELENIRTPDGRRQGDFIYTMGSIL
ncbi:MAG: hypothetical protein E7510_06020 [Ruminococcus sp.]|nr:hypothetical protein [Ruminococcus sp.]